MHAPGTIRTIRDGENVGHTDWRVGWLVALALGLLLSMSMDVAAAVGDDAGAGTLYFRTSQTEVEAPRLHTHVQMDVTGIVARVEVTQRFQNNSDDWVEGVYAFPLPENSAVDRMRMQVGKRTIVGEIKEKVQAEKLYERARAEGQRASLVQQHRPNLFRTSVANIGPHEAIEITIGYLQIVSRQEGKFSVRFPMTITPRYLPGVIDDEQVLTPDTPVHAISPISAGPRDTVRLSDMQPPLAQPDVRRNGITFDIKIEAGVPLESVNSRYHAVNVRRQNTRYSVVLSDAVVSPDRDFELEWRPDVRGEPVATLFREKTGDGDHVLIMFLPPHEKLKLATPREVIFIIDTSGSMSGESIRQAKQALLKALETLGPRDKFNVIQFNSIFNSVFSGTVPADSANRQRAVEYVSALQATGGTEMLPALNAAMNTPVIGEYLRQIIFITDGAVGNEDQLTRAIHQDLGTARLFTVGIGSAPNGFFMRKAAEMGRGTFTYIGSTSEVDEKVTELIGKIEQPALTNIEMTWPDGLVPEMAPSRVGDLYAGEPLVVTARLPRDARGVLKLRGQSASVWSRELQLGRGGSYKGVSTLWARTKISELMDQHVSNVDDDTIRSQVLPLALSYGLVTKYTSLIAVDKTPARDSNQPLQSQQVPNAKPDGSTWDAVSYPKTATPAQLQLMIGTGALFLAGFLAVGRRKWR